MLEHEAIKINNYIEQPQKLFDGIYLVGGESPHQFNSLSYLIKGNPNVIVDCGSREGYPYLSENLAKLSISTHEDFVIIGTHAHRDHVEAVTDFKAQNPNTELWMHFKDEDAVEKGDYHTTASYLYNKPFRPTTVDRQLHDGELLNEGNIEIEVVHTPGHTDGSISLIINRDNKTIIFGGDTLWGGYTKGNSDLKKWRSSLLKLSQRYPDYLLAGHVPFSAVPQKGTSLSRSIPDFGKNLLPSFKVLVTPWK